MTTSKVINGDLMDTVTVTDKHLRGVFTVTVTSVVSFLLGEVLRNPMLYIQNALKGPLYSDTMGDFDIGVSAT